MNNFVFYNPTKLIFGSSTISNIGAEIASLSLKKALLLAGSGSIKRNGTYEQAVNSLIANGIEYVELWGVSPNPCLNHAREAIKLCKENDVDCIIAIGGGSVIDEAKSVAAGFYLDDIWDAYERHAKITKALPIFTILTLSGTGSEMNPFAVLTNEEEKKKWSIGSPLIYPKATIIDPNVQMSLPWHQTVNGGIDAISHTLEFYFAAKDCEMSSVICEGIILTVIDSLDKLQIDGSDYNARASLAWAATLALNGIAGASVIGEWSAHRIEHGISALFTEVAHGAGLAVVFPAWIEYTKETSPEQYKRFAQSIWQCETIDEAILAIKKKFSEWSAPVSLRELNIPESMIPMIAENAASLGVVGCLMPLGKKEMQEILEIAY